MNSRGDNGANERHTGDVAPGAMDTTQQSIWSSIRSYIVGFLLAGALTAASFYVAPTGLIWTPAIPVALAVLAVAQVGVHLIFFLHITTAPDNTNNTLALAFGVFIVLLVFLGSLWIMAHLASRMMPMAGIIAIATQ